MFNSIGNPRETRLQAPHAPPNTAGRRHRLASTAASLAPPQNFLDRTNRLLLTDEFGNLAGQRRDFTGVTTCLGCH